MPDVLVPMSGVNPEKFLAKQVYKTDAISQNMFTGSSKKDKKLMVAPTVLKGVSIQRLWDNVFADNTTFLQRYHDRRKELNLNVGAWEYAADKGSGYRFVSLTTIVEVPHAGTETPLNEAHRFAYVTMDDGKLLLTYHISSQTPNVPAGSTFRTEALAEIVASSPDADCTVAFYGNCKKMSLGFSAIQYIATPRALREMTAGYKLMLDVISEDLCGGAPAPAAPISDGAEATEARADDSVSGGGGGGGGGESASPSRALQGVLLVFAVILMFAVLPSSSVVRDVARTTHQLSSMDAPVMNQPLSPMTEEQALMNAAREAQFQTLRDQIRSQNMAIASLENTISWLWFLSVANIALIASVVIKTLLF